MTAIRKRLTYANVMSTLSVFLVLGGATAFAATQLPKNSVGTKQLRNNAVITKKIKKNAVSRAKIRKGAINTARLKGNAVTTAKIKKNAVTGAKIKASTTPFSRVTARLRNAGPVSLEPAGSTLIGTYAQPAGENDQYTAGLEVTFDAGCTAPREAMAYLIIDPSDPNKPSSLEIAGFGAVFDETGTTSSHQMSFIPFPVGTFRGLWSFEPSETEDHSFYIYPVDIECTAGSGATASEFSVDVIGTR